MFRTVLGLSVILLVCAASSAIAQEPPPLEAPAAEPDQPNVERTPGSKASAVTVVARIRCHGTFHAFLSTASKADAGDSRRDVPSPAPWTSR